MERGTDRELKALRERWTAMERRRELADRLVYGAALVGVGALLLLLSIPTKACVHGGGVAGAMCTPIKGPPVGRAGLVVVGVALLFGGAWFFWRLQRSRVASRRP